MAAFKMTEDSEVFFVFARQMLIHAASQAPPEQFVLLDGLGTIATGLEIMSAERKTMRKQLDDIETSLQHVAQTRRP